MDKVHSPLITRYNLEYVYEEPPGIRRLKRGRGFSYVDVHENLITQPDLRKRLQSIAVPPSYEKVWYCPLDNGHLQATGFDSTHKKQYFYHSLWRQIQDAQKFDSLYEFGQKLPSFRRKINQLIDLENINKQTVLATMARLLNETGMRIGNDNATKNNATHGLTTLEKKHVNVKDNEIFLDYIGKGGQEIQRFLNDPKISHVINNCAEIPGQRLFKIINDEGKKEFLNSQDLNQFLKTLMDESFSAKDFRTWRFSCYFIEKSLSAKNTKSSTTLTSILDKVSEKSGNTPSILKSSYIHPGLIELVKNKDWKLLEKPQKVRTGLKQSEEIFLNYLKTNHAKDILLNVKNA